MKTNTENFDDGLTRVVPNHKKCKDKTCGICCPKKCDGCGKIKQVFREAFTHKFYCVNCINKSWKDEK